MVKQGKKRDKINVFAYSSKVVKQAEQMCGIRWSGKREIPLLVQIEQASRNRAKSTFSSLHDQFTAPCRMGGGTTKEIKLTVTADDDTQTTISLKRDGLFWDVDAAGALKSEEISAYLVGLGMVAFDQVDEWGDIFETIEKLLRDEQWSMDVKEFGIKPVEEDES